MIVVLLNPSSSGNAFSILSSNFLLLLDGLSKMTLPLEITVLTFSNPSFSKTPRSLSFRILGFVGAMPRNRATYLAIVCFRTYLLTFGSSCRLLPLRFPPLYQCNKEPPSRRFLHAEGFPSHRQRRSLIMSMQVCM